MKLSELAEQAGWTVSVEDGQDYEIRIATWDHVAKAHVDYEDIYGTFVKEGSITLTIGEVSEKKQAIEPEHYRVNGKDLFDEWHERYYNSEKLYTGREVFVAIMKAVAERYSRRYPEKNEEDLEKSIYTLSRLKEYEVQHDSEV